MKKISNLSHAKAVHAVKSIGKVLLPVALLLAAILCIGVCAGAEDSTAASVTYTYYNESMHIKIENGTPTFEAHDLKGPECSTSGICKDCGYVGTKTADETKHVWAKVVDVKYLEKEKSCEATNVYYESCSACGIINSSATFEGSKSTGKHTHNQKKEANLIKKPDGACNTLKQYKGQCACGDVSDTVIITDTVTYGHDAAKVQHFNGTLTAEMKSAGRAVSDLAVNGSLCGLATEYYDFCPECGDVLTSKTAYTADSAEALATLIANIHGSNTTYIVKSYNSDAHWEVCTACNTIVASAKHSYNVVDKDVSCANPKQCTECQYVAKSVDHKFVYHAAVDATCDTNGNKAYYTCSECNGLFDAERKATTADKLVVSATSHKQANKKAPLCNPGVCSVCGKEIAASAEHEYDNTADSYYPLGKDGKPNKSSNKMSCTAVCKNCGKVNGTHSYAAKQTEGKSACEKGYATWTECLDCGDVQNYVENKETSHVYPALGTYPCDKDIKCTACGTTFRSRHKIADNFEYDCTQPLNVVCINCKNVFTEAKNVYNNKMGHNNVWTPEKAATCTTNGNTAGYSCTHTITINPGTEAEQTFKCTAGGDVKTVKKTGHTWGEYQVTREATCVISGQKNRQCTVCKDWDKVVDTGVDASAHKWSSDYRMTGDKKSHYHYCINIGLDGKQCSEAATAEEHTYYVTVDGKQVEVTEKDCRGVAKCVCGATLAKGECKNETKYDTANHWKVCKVCGTVTGKVAHTINTVEAKAATCGADGYASHLACSCGYAPQEYEKYPATGAHTWSAWGYADKAYKKGQTVKNEAANAQNTYHYRKCGCGEIETHASVSDNAANCIYPNRCTTCELTILKSKDSKGACNEVEKPALGHDLDGVTTVVTESTHSVTCKRCSATIVEAHKLPVDAHACVDNKCAVCDYVIKATDKHTAPENTELEQTASGHGYTCTACQKFVSEAHEYNLQVIDCTADIKCTVCGFVVASGYKSHDVDFSNIVDAVAPTCTTAGHSAGFKCTRCNYVYGGTTLPATGHSFQLVAGKEPTETEDGYTQHFACSVCGATEGKEVLSKTGSTVVKGDFNGDGKVTSDDAIALLKAILLGNEANQDKDYNGDGKADSADAIALLKAALLG